MKPIRLSVIRFVVTLFLAAIAAFGSVWAATITVASNADNTTASDDQCTLREAIANVNAAAAPEPPGIAWPGRARATRAAARTS